MKNNPYIGPRPYERQDRRNFYGRKREARELCSLIRSEREVLFYAQSGAGKTSLLNASVIPTLEEEDFIVLPVARVGSELPSGIAADQVNNIFVFSTLLTLAGEEADPQALQDQTFLHYLRPLCEARVANAGSVDTDSTDAAPAEAHPVVLILDQFEEIFTTHRERWQEATGFFQQMREALDTLPNLGVVLAMREDHVAAVDPYAPHFPRRLRARFRMERLGPRGALTAVKQPAENAGCRYDPGVAERLVDNLRRINVGAGLVPALGPYVEPVQLQVVCSRLWENLPEQVDNAIQWEEIEQYGNIDRALIDFYESAIAAAIAQGDVSERQVRRWFGEELITTAETRGLVLQGSEKTGDLPNATVDVLEAEHIIRAETRAGARWYELSHDRLVTPIVDANREWEAAQAQLRPWLPVARQWQVAQSTTLLYRGKELETARAWLETVAPNEVEAYEREFIEASLEAERARARTRRLIIAGGILAVIVIAALTTLTILAVRSSQRAADAEQEAKDASRNAVARMLGAQGQLEFEQDPLLGIGLALEGLALLTPEDTDTQEVLRVQMAEMAQHGRLLKLGDDIEAIYPSPDGTFFIVDYYEDVRGELRRTADATLVELPGAVGRVEFSPNPTATTFVIYYASNTPDELRRTADGTVVTDLPSSIKDVEFSPDPAATYFFVDYWGDTPDELRHTEDGTVVASLLGAVEWAFFNPPATHLFVLYADDTPDELRRTADGAVVIEFPDKVQAVYQSLNSAATYFIVDYWGDTYTELRRTADDTVVTDIPGAVRDVEFSPDPAATYFVVDYADDTPTELRRTEDGTVVEFLGEIIKANLSPDPAATYIIMKYTDAPDELRHTTDGTLVEFSGAVRDVEFSPDPAATYFVVDYWGDTPDELRHTADNTVVTALTGDVEYVYFSPDRAASYVVVNYADTPDELRRTADGTVITALPGAVWGVDFSPDPAASYIVVDYVSIDTELRRTADGILITELSSNDTSVEGFSPDPEATYLVVTSREHREVWHTAGYLLVDLGGGVGENLFDLDARRLTIRYGDGRAYLLDLAWLTAMWGAPDELTVDELTRAICEGPMATGLLDEQALLTYLDGREIQLCLNEDMNE